METDITNLDNSNPFKTPKDYFSKLEKSILLKTVGEGENTNPFKTPDLYFENLEANLISKTIESKKTGKIVSLFSTKLYWISAAACIFFVLMMGIYMYNSEVEHPTLASKATEKVDLVLDETFDFPEEENISETATLSSESLTESHPEIIKNNTVKAVTYKKEAIQPTTQKTSEVIYKLYFDEGNETDKEEEFFL